LVALLQTPPATFALPAAIIVGIAPGPVVADPAILNFRYVRPDVRRRPRTG
jgi:hypothetical protein